MCNENVKRESRGTVKRRKINCTGHTLRGNCVLKPVTEGEIGRIQVTGRQRRRRKHLLNDLKETRVKWKLEKETLDRTVWRTGFGSSLDMS